MASSTVASVVFPQGVGYGVVIGIGFFFALLMMFMSYIQVRSPTAEFMHDAAGATVQIFMFSVLACKVKQNAPYCHTFLEIIYYRYGKATHITFIFFALLTNVLVASQLLLGGSAVVTALTGMNVYAAVFLIPLGVCAYVVLGGLRATFLCDYTHTVIMLSIILYFMFSVYSTSELIGSPAKMFELLQKAAIERPVSGNMDGSYLTMKSNYALVFGVIQLCSGLGTVFLDQGYWQRAIASRPTTAVRAYIMGGLAWFAIPFGFATTLGLCAVALTDNPRFPTYPSPMSDSQVSSGLSAPFAATALLGKSGAGALLLTLFMAVTSSASSELIAVSSILTFDIYKIYVKPSATPEQLIFVSHVMICFFGLIMATFACIWNAVGVDLGWLFLTMGLLIGGAVFPAAFAITWKGQTRLGAMSGAIGGCIAGITAWLVEAKVYYGELTIATTGSSYPTLAGNLAAVMTGLIFSVTISLIKPDDFNWEITRSINMDMPKAAETVVARTDGGPLSEKNVAAMSPPVDPPKDKTAASDNVAAEGPIFDDEEKRENEGMIEDPKRLKSAFTVALVSSAVLSFIMDFLIPIPMFLSRYVFSEGFFTAWLVISFIWVFGSLTLCGFLPVFETRDFFKELLMRSVWSGKKSS
ncbi:hypothetical protein N7474_005504 [Penicillium riverlandense]|uniref:uncharacterized protein n=1 Tax=Penicillium riverlandense TaxID=1903569 RepID=UPI00254866E3|nr:uncharacterized protein N7474_005504 [Penicillium riverlandense]KAJ5819913.1 hypothetical protein N7474_005504 [Penicillium riverlandense]